MCWIQSWDLGLAHFGDCCTDAPFVGAGRGGGAPLLADHCVPGGTRPCTHSVLQK